ncbi:MAG TPA: helix-turn-helix domain-containing protein [Caulobacteraceae bacterium]|nr:helix-turn-helix domain-containing protein [Caulobacteraceae bacterium]
MVQAVGGEISEGIVPFMSGGEGFGGALRALRESRGLSLEDVAEVTRIRRAYLAALEEMRLDQLPSRPFAIGYVRAYAQVLGVDPDAVVAKFKQCAPSDDAPLQAPTGVRRQRDPRLSVAAGAAGVVVTAVLIWNVAQHAVAGDGPASPPAPVLAVASPVALHGPVPVGAAQPAPPESDVPKPYITPGLAPVSASAAPQTDAIAEPAQFVAKGAVFGAPAGQSPVTLQAAKPASLVVRGPDGTVYFARQLAAGESYRAPVAVKGLVVDVSEPQAFYVYLNGAAHGQLAASQTPVEKLAS